MAEKIAWKVVKEAGQPLYHVSLIYPWADRIGAPAVNVRFSLDEDELRSLQDALAEALYGVEACPASLSDVVQAQDD